LPAQILALNLQPITLYATYRRHTVKNLTLQLFNIKSKKEEEQNFHATLEAIIKHQVSTHVL